MMVSQSSRIFILCAMSAHRWALAVSLAAAALAMSAPARAADSSEDDLNRQGVEARKRGDDAAALDAFRKAYGLHHSPRGAAQMALAEIALGRWADAATHLEEALASPNDPWIRKNEQVLRESLDRVLDQFGTLQVIGSPSGAEVVVEGRVVGTVPMNQPARIRVGDCKFEVRAPGYASVTRAVAIESSVPRRETVELSATSLSVVSQPQAATVRSIDPQRQPPPTEPDSGSRPGHSGVRTAGVVMGASGLVAIATGVGFGIAARSAGKNNSQTGNTFDPNADSTGKTFQTLQYVGLGLGAALLVAGTVTYLLGGDSDHGSNSAQVAVLPQAGGALAGLSGTF
jgi:hypothetical protein